MGAAPGPALLLGFHGDIAWTRCHLQPDPCEKAAYHYFFKVMSFQTQQPLDGPGGVRHQTTQHRCSPTKAFLALVAARAPLQPLSVSPGVGPSSRWFLSVPPRVGLTETHCRRAVSLLQLRSVPGEADVLVLRKTVCRQLS